MAKKRVCSFLMVIAVLMSMLPAVAAWAGEGEQFAISDGPYTIQFRCNVADAEIIVYTADELQWYAEDDSIRLYPGQYRYLIAADGYQPESDAFDVRSDLVIDIHLREADSKA